MQRSFPLGGTAVQFTWIIALLFAILVALFAVQNTTPVTVSFLFWSASQVAVALVIIASVAVGALITMLASLPRLVRGRLRTRALRRDLRQYEQRIAELEAELERYRSRPAVRELPAPGETTSGPSDTPPTLGSDLVTPR